MQVNNVIYEPDFEKKSKKELNIDYLQVKKIFDRQSPIYKNKRTFNTPL